MQQATENGDRTGIGEGAQDGKGKD